MIAAPPSPSVKAAKICVFLWASLMSLALPGKVASLLSESCFAPSARTPVTTAPAASPPVTVQPIQTDEWLDGEAGAVEAVPACACAVAGAGAEAEPESAGGGGAGGGGAGDAAGA